MGPGPELELAGLLIVVMDARNVGGHQVRGALYAAEAATQRLCQATGQGSLAYGPAHLQTRTCPPLSTAARVSSMTASLPTRTTPDTGLDRSRYLRHPGGAFGGSAGRVGCAITSLSKYLGHRLHTAARLARRAFPPE